MSGSGLGRRGAIYFVRFRLPVRLAKMLGVTHLQRSLHTAQLHVAKRRAALGRVWFDALCSALMSSTAPTRQNLEDAARRYFDALRLESLPRNVPWEHWESFEAEQTELTKQRLSEIADQLSQNVFDSVIQQRATELVSHGDFDPEDSAGPSWNAVLALAARVERQRLLHDLHRILSPEAGFTADDTLFDGYGPEAARPPSKPRREPTADRLQLLQLEEVDSPRGRTGPLLSDVIGEYLNKRRARGLSASSIAEAKRALDWLDQLFPKTPMSDLGKEQLRSFRDAIQRLDRRLQGRSASFSDRQTNERQHQLALATQKKYWAASKAFCAWCEAEGYLANDPASGLKLEPRKGEVARTPAPFSDAELTKFFSTPLYTGYASHKRLHDAGTSKVRNAQWWAGVLPLFTGLRAGELTQLLPADFEFGEGVSLIHVRIDDGDGGLTKSTKNASSIRSIPIAQALLTLGLRQFVQRRSKAYPKQRIFREFRLGTNGRTSDGMTKFWGAYLKKYDLWKPGRATHVARHTFADRLRAAGVSDADIGVLLGHAASSQTAAYGTYPLARKAEIVAKLDYGADFVDRLGGAYTPDHLA